jgi:uncharacterized membrane protein YjgN (DUF898 family)
MKDFLKLFFGKFSLKPAITPEIYLVTAIVFASLLTWLVLWGMRFFH